MTIFLPPHLIGRTPEEIIGNGDRFKLVDDFVHDQLHGILTGTDLDTEIQNSPKEGEGNLPVSAIN